MGIFDKIREGLKKTRDNISGQITQMVNSFTKIDEEAGSTTCWLVPNAQKNRMEPIVLTLQPGGRSYEDDPHEGEEFGYVLSGSVLLTIGGAKHKLKKGDSFYFAPTRPHSLANRGKSEAKILWGTDPPNF